MGFIAPVIGAIGGAIGGALPWIATGAGVLTTAYAAKQQAEAENQAAEYNAQIMDFNADAAGMQAGQVKTQGELEAKQLRLQASKMKSTQKSLLASSGALVGDGSAEDLLNDTVRVGEQDAMTAVHNAALQSWGYNVEETRSRSQGKLQRASKSNSNRAFGTALLTGGSRVASSLLR